MSIIVLSVNVLETHILRDNPFFVLQLNVGSKTRAMSELTVNSVRLLFKFFVRRTQYLK
jgi:hypothetical protein